MVAQNIAFGIIAAITVAAALGMVTTRNIVRCWAALRPTTCC